MTGDWIEGMESGPGWASRKRWNSPRAKEIPFTDEDRERATEVLVIAQRTAEEHIRSTRIEAEGVRTRAMSAATEIVRDAEAYAEETRRKADQMLAEAKDDANGLSRNARDRAGEAEERATAILSEAHARAKQIDMDAKLSAEEIRRRARVELDRLEADRESLLRQIESLEEFDRDYRLKLLGFMQGQMRALWADNPQVLGEPDGMPPAQA